jgi:hypothetical protein
MAIIIVARWWWVVDDLSNLARTNEDDTNYSIISDLSHRKIFYPSTFTS